MASKGEELIAKILIKSKIQFEQEKTFYDLKKGAIVMIFILII